MGEFLHILAGWIETIWPFRVVRQWERGGYYVCGKLWRVVDPGIYALVPWFMVMHEVSVVPELVDTGRQDVTLRDGRLLSFSASAWVKVVDVNKAVNEVDQYDKTVREVIRSVLADKLASVEATRLEPGSRARLQADLARWSNDEAKLFGMEVSDVRFTSFVTNPRTYRLLGNTQDWQ